MAEAAIIEAQMEAIVQLIMLGTIIISTVGMVVICYLFSSDD